MNSSILIVDDEAGVRSSLAGVLRDEGYAVEAVATGEACLDRLTRGGVDLIVLDVWLPGMDGLDTLARLRERHVDAQVVLISGHGNIESAVRAIKLGAFDFVEKPLSLDKTVLVIRNALRQRRLEAENQALRARVDRHHTMVGESYPLRQLREQVDPQFKAIDEGARARIREVLTPEQLKKYNEFRDSHPRGDRGRGPRPADWDKKNDREKDSSSKQH